MTSGDTVTVDGAVNGLEALGADLSGRGFMTTVMEGGGPPCVRVVSRVTAQLSENVYAAPADDGSLWFWWSWAERIAPIGHVGVDRRQGSAGPRSPAVVALITVKCGAG